MTKPPELLPCPFCGGACEMWNANDGRPAWIACMGRCAVLISKEHKTDAEAIAAWNARTPDPAVQALVDALRFYANPEIYEPHPHGSAFDRRDVSYVAAAALTAWESRNA